MRLLVRTIIQFTKVLLFKDSLFYTRDIIYRYPLPSSKPYRGLSPFQAFQLVNKKRKLFPGE